MSQTTRQREFKGVPEVLYLSFELGSTEWKLAFTVGRGEKPRLRTLAAGDLRGVEQEIERARQRWGVREGARVVSCYEAGRDGFWLHRFLLSRGVENLVVDSSSIEVNRRSRRAKTDRLDALKLLTMLIRHDLGEERRVFSVVRVPSVEQEAERQLHRDWEELKKERTLHRNRIQSLLACHGIFLKLGADFGECMESLTLWDGSAVAAKLRERLKREWKRLELVESQIRELNQAETGGGGRGFQCLLAADPEVGDVERDRSDQRLGVRVRIFRLAPVPQPSRGGRLGGLGADAVPERLFGSRARHNSTLSD